MRFGTPVVIRRGGHPRSVMVKGCWREVRGVLIGARGRQRLCRLLRNDPLACSKPNMAGEVGWWGASVVCPLRQPSRRAQS